FYIRLVSESPKRAVARSVSAAASAPRESLEAARRRRRRFPGRLFIGHANSRADFRALLRAIHAGPAKDELLELHAADRPGLFRQGHGIAVVGPRSSCRRRAATTLDRWHRDYSGCCALDCGRFIHSLART